MIRLHKHMVQELLKYGITYTERAVYTYNSMTHTVYKWAGQAGVDGRPVLLEAKVIDLESRGARYEGRDKL